MEVMKTDMTLFFCGHMEVLANMRETAVHGFTSLQAEHSKLKEQIKLSSSQHKTVRLFSSPQLLSSAHCTFKHILVT